jgi:hypothetical protein
MAWDIKSPRPSGSYSVDSSAKQAGAEHTPKRRWPMATKPTAARITRDLG